MLWHFSSSPLVDDAIVQSLSRHPPGSDVFGALHRVRLLRLFQFVRVVCLTSGERLWLLALALPSRWSATVVALIYVVPPSFVRLRFQPALFPKGNPSALMLDDLNKQTDRSLKRELG